MMRRVLFIVILACMLFGTAHAFKLSPLFITLTSSGPNASTRLVIENTRDKPLTIELTAYEAFVDEAGKETRVLAEDDFLLFPPQAIVEPGERQSIKVQYLGELDNSSRFYRLLVSEIPIDLEQRSGSAGVKVAFEYAVATYVADPGMDFDIEVLAIERDADLYNVTVRNHGNRHSVLSSGDIIGKSSSGDTLALSFASFDSEMSLIAPNSTRVLTISASSIGELSDLASLEFTPER